MSSFQQSEDKGKAGSGTITCGEQAVMLLNCLAKHGKEACSSEMEAFLACAVKAGLKEFVLLQECPSPAPAVVSLSFYICIQQFFSSHNAQIFDWWS